MNRAERRAARKQERRQRKAAQMAEGWLGPSIEIRAARAKVLVALPVSCNDMAPRATSLLLMVGITAIAVTGVREGRLPENGLSRLTWPASPSVEWGEIEGFTTATAGPVKVALSGDPRWFGEVLVCAWRALRDGKAPAIGMGGGAYDAVLAGPAGGEA